MGPGRGGICEPGGGGYHLEKILKPFSCNESFTMPFYVNIHRVAPILWQTRQGIGPASTFYRLRYWLGPGRKREASICMRLDELEVSSLSTGILMECVVGCILKACLGGCLNWT